ncbi:MAG: helix-turn-helix domain-containing protein, partial [Arcobacter sp.]
DINTYKLIINDEIYTLNQKETLLLKHLLKNKNSCVTFDMIFESVWTFDETNNYESLRTYIKNLRKYLGKDRIKNIKKQGYMFA